MFFILQFMNQGYVGVWWLKYDMTAACLEIGRVTVSQINPNLFFKAKDQCIQNVPSIRTYVTSWKPFCLQINNEDYNAKT